ncbi:MAG: FAD-dependent oxidoreductase [Solirubrobacteraceae bacterium]|nr:FAD-dependent oxidoreductase [Solirubrobacteraceae bacterium]
MRVVVVGAGIAGTAAARRLRRQGVDVVVLEAADAVGGRTRTVDVDGFRVDTGAIFVMGQYDRTLEWLREDGHADDPVRWEAHTAVLGRDGHLHRVRFDRPWTLLRQPGVGWAGRLRAAARLAPMVARPGPGPFTLDELAPIDDGETLDAWGRRTLGDRAHEHVLRPLMGPLTGADPTVISAPFTRALVHRITRTRLTVPTTGMGALAGWLATDVDVRCDTPVRTVEHHPHGVVVTTDDERLEADAVVVATDVLTAGGLLDGVVDDHLVDALRSVTPIRTHHVLLGYRRDPWPHVPYDLVVRANEGPHHDYGVLRNARRSRGSVPPGGETVSVYLDTAQVGDRAPLEVAREAVAETFGPATADVERVFTLDAGLIAPTPGHYRRMLALRDGMPERIRLAGDFLTHSGIEGALRSGERAADDLLASRSRVGAAGQAGGAGPSSRAAR